MSMYINDIINEFSFKECPYELGTVDWALYKDRLDKDIDGVKCSKTDSGPLHKELKQILIPSYSSILTGISIKFKNLDNSEINDINNLPMKLIIQLPVFENQINDNNSIMFYPNDKYKRIELYNFKDNKLELDEPLILPAFPRISSNTLFCHTIMYIELGEYFREKLIIEITTNWIDFKYDHRIHKQIYDRVFLSKYFEYRENEIVKI